MTPLERHKTILLDFQQFFQANVLASSVVTLVRRLSSKIKWFSRTKSAYFDKCKYSRVYSARPTGQNLVLPLVYLFLFSDIQGVAKSEYDRPSITENLKKKILKNVVNSH